MGFTACRGNQDARISTDVWQKENLECDTLLSLLFLVFLCFHVPELFYTIYSLIACSGVCSFYFIHKKLTQFCMYIATPLNKGSMLHQINRWGCRQSSCWLHVGFRMAANSSTSICLKFGNMVVIVTLAHTAELVLQELR